MTTVELPRFTAAQQDLIEQEQALLGRLTEVMERFPGAAEDRTTVRDVARALDDVFSVVIVGEFNAGKSAFINALLGQPVMEEGATPTTTRINILRAGAEVTQGINSDGFVVVTHPAPFLGQVTVVDTPGTNAVIREHEAVTQQFIPRADLILFVTSADRPFSESERKFMSEIRAWGKKVVIIINKVDLLSDADLAKVLSFVREQVRALIGFTPEVFPVAARLALAAKQSPPGDVRDALWARSRFAPLEQYVIETLDLPRRLRLKLLSPLGVTARVMGRYREAADERLALLAGDRETLARIEGQLGVYRGDMEHGFTHYLTMVDNVVLQLVARGDAFFADTLRIGRIPDLLNSERTRGAWEREVVRDTPQQIDGIVQGLIDWMVEHDLRTWQAVTELVRRRQTVQPNTEMIGEVSERFAYDRQALLNSVGARAQEVVQRYNASGEAERLSREVQAAVFQAGLVQIGAVGLGAAVVAAATTALADFTGILAATMIAALGLVILPAKRRRAQEQFHARAEDLRTRLMATLREQFAGELDRSLARIGEAVAPYTRFVRAEAERMEEIRGELLAIQGESDRLRYAIDALVPEIGAIPGTDANPYSPTIEPRSSLARPFGLPPGTPVSDPATAVHR
ncbi:MAG: dynamin family protein [Thermomicrobiales bacterium]